MDVNKKSASIFPLSSAAFTVFVRIVEGTPISLMDENVSAFSCHVEL
jgi:hypothetical protein